MVATLSKPSRERYAKGKSLSTDRPPDRRETAFAALIAKGYPQWKAYAESTGTKRKSTCLVQAWRWLARPAVSAEVARQRRALTEHDAMTRAEKRLIISTVARDDATPPQVRIAAIQVDNRMTGDDEPLRVVHSGAVVFSIDPIDRPEKLVDPVDVLATPGNPALP